MNEGMNNSDNDNANVNVNSSFEIFNIFFKNLNFISYIELKVDSNTEATIGLQE